MTAILGSQSQEVSTSELREPWKEIFQAALELAKQAGQLKSLAKKLSAREGYDSLKKLSKALEKLHSVELPDEHLMAQTRKATSSVNNWLEAEWDRRAQQFSNELLDYFRERDTEAKLDEVTVLVHPFTLKVEAAADRVVLSYLDEEMFKTSLSCEKVFKQWQKSRDLLEKNVTPPEAFLELLERAYDEMLRVQGKSQGARFRLSDLHFRLFVLRQTAQVRQDPRKGNVKEYPRYQFAYDLGLLLEQQAEGFKISSDGKTFIFHQASKKAASSRSSSVQVEIGNGAITAVSDLEIVG